MAGIFNNKIRVLARVKIFFTDILKNLEKRRDTDTA